MIWGEGAVFAWTRLLTTPCGLTAAQSPPAGYAGRGCDTSWDGHLEGCCQYTAHSGWGAQTCCWIPASSLESQAGQSLPCTSTRWGCSGVGSQSAPPAGGSGCSSRPAKCWHGSSLFGVPHHISRHLGQGETKLSQSLRTRNIKALVWDEQEKVLALHSHQLHKRKRRGSYQRRKAVFMGGREQGWFRKQHHLIFSMMWSWSDTTGPWFLLRGLHCIKLCVLCQIWLANLTQTNLQLQDTDLHSYSQPPQKWKTQLELNNPSPKMQFYPAKLGHISNTKSDQPILRLVLILRTTASSQK